MARRGRAPLFAEAMVRIAVAVPKEWRDTARNMGLNISEICREALRQAVEVDASRRALVEEQEGLERRLAIVKAQVDRTTVEGEEKDRMVAQFRLRAIQGIGDGQNLEWIRARWPRKDATALLRELKEGLRRDPEVA